MSFEADRPPSSAPDGSPERPPTIRLEHFLKFPGLTETGGQAKFRIQGGEVKVNGTLETRRGRQLRLGDEVEIDGRGYKVETRDLRGK